ncbi:MAG TPA: ABC transporter ATP-binding protein, partial [Candidatus Bathyarchaeota archaeon]|nr:ABC transporter ATP-binding protein [Candidatus Bathyarchaeota archaeon]
MYAVEAEDVSKRYGDVIAVDGVSLTVDRDMLYAIMGPNGSGKSTLLSMIATVNRPSGGVIRVMGHDVVGETDEVRRLINYIPEFNFSSQHLTGLENLVFYAALLGIPRSEARDIAQELLRRVGLNEAANRLVSTYSRGMRRRLELATAFLGDRPLIILDEPSGGLDPSMRRVVMGWLLEEVRERDRTILLATHIGEDAEAADRVAFMKDGRIVAEGHPEELKRRYIRESIIDVKLAVKGLKALELLRGFAIN